MKVNYNFSVDFTPQQIQAIKEDIELSNTGETVEEYTESLVNIAKDAIESFINTKETEYEK